MTWTTRAAEQVFYDSWKESLTKSEVAAIIEAHAGLLIELLAETRRQHVDADDGYCRYLTGGDCTCGAAAWNARVDEVFR